MSVGVESTGPVTTVILDRPERRQADAVRGGTTLRGQFRFSEYLKGRAVDPYIHVSEAPSGTW
jgi:hypothetical protein